MVSGLNAPLYITIDYYCLGFRLETFSLNLSQSLVILHYEGVTHYEKGVVSDNTRDMLYLPSHVWATR